MQDVVQCDAVLLTGNWLVKERQRIGVTRSQLSRAVQSHSATLRSIEEHNRVIPPGWYPALRLLGMRVQEPIWPASAMTYYGTELNRDLRTCASLQNSRFWLSRQLYVAESEVAAVLRGNLPVPSNWLLKLAELGANVPAQVRMALSSTFSEVSSSPKAKAARVPTTPVEENRSQASHVREFRPEATAENSHAGCQAPAAGGSSPRATVGVETSTSAPKMRERFSIFFRMSEEGGLHFSVDVPFLKKVCFKVALGITDWIRDADVNSGPSTRANPAHLRDGGATANRSE